VQNVVNPFTKTFSFDAIIGEAGTLEVSLLHASGQQLRRKSIPVREGINNINLDGTNDLTSGIYILQVQYKGKLLTRKLIRR
ncbi:MAG TPA: T9SS type A sorting domain-containing protein, partial [Flavisolibacter sp.]|nr:T9SS type A sorting domain-containing protein [Flavisolibacter sp.]